MSWVKSLHAGLDTATAPACLHVICWEALPLTHPRSLSSARAANEYKDMGRDHKFT